jgi:hypothetical protein
MTKKKKAGKGKSEQPELLVIESADLEAPGGDVYVGLMSIWLGPPLASARAWLHATAPVSSVEVLDRAYPRGSTAREHLLTLLEFYETVGALVRHGVVDEDLFLAAPLGFEVLWSRVGPAIVDWRSRSGDPSAWEHMAWLAGRLGGEVPVEPAPAQGEPSDDQGEA